ncbi:MAG TPA: pyroglutamyl-peptidase I [Pseudolabrys sp.]|nr:pyroglutamyl-peptidase I [Pseudolabrys sp.]
MLSLLITGFGPFPGAPFNPSGALAQRLARQRRPALSGVRIATHVFDVSYAAVDRDLPRLIETHRPDVLLMFGLAARSRQVRIETRVRNARATFPDASGRRPTLRSIVPGAPARDLMLPRQPLFAAARRTGIPVRLSRDAGAYLCNYLCWRALDAAGTPGGPRCVTFVHVPLVSRTSRVPAAARRIGFPDLVRIGETMLTVLIANTPITNAWRR